MGIAIDYTQHKIINILLLAALTGLTIILLFTPVTASPLASPLHSPLLPVPNRLQVSAWMPTSWDGEAARASFDAHMDALSTLSPYWYGIQDDGHLTTWAGARDGGLLAQARGEGIRVIPTISNNFNGDRLHAILNDPTLASAHRQAILNEVATYDYDGIDLDYENLAAADKELFSAWVQTLADALHARGKLLTVTVQPKTFDAAGWDGPGALDYRALAGAADELRLMTYGWCWRTGCVGSDPPGPIAPIHWMQRVIDYAKTQAPAEKLVLGVHLYGYDWSEAGEQYSVSSKQYSVSSKQYSVNSKQYSVSRCHEQLHADKDVNLNAGDADFYDFRRYFQKDQRSSALSAAYSRNSKQYAVSSGRWPGMGVEDMNGQALVWEQANALLQEHQAQLQWWQSDDRGLVQEPWFSYADGAHTVAFANADSVAARAQLAEDAGLRGIIFWRLGGEDPALWARLPQRVYRLWLPHQLSPAPASP